MLVLGYPGRSGKILHSQELSFKFVADLQASLRCGGPSSRGTISSSSKTGTPTARSQCHQASTMSYTRGWTSSASWARTPRWVRKCKASLHATRNSHLRSGGQASKR
eukprot:scaffold112039_cov20-Tisochrysis_lutea.AAC.6